jgi:hypothetical protein
MHEKVVGVFAFLCATSKKYTENESTNNFGAFRTDTISYTMEGRDVGAGIVALQLETQ